MPLESKGYRNKRPAGEYEVITFREFARRVNCVESLVRYAIQQGKLVESPFQENEMKRPKLAYEIALKEWKQSGMQEQSEKMNFEEDVNINNSSSQENILTDKQFDNPFGRSSQLTKLREQKLTLEVQKRALELKEIHGSLVRKDIVYKQLRSFGQEIRDSIQRIPEQVIDEILSAPTRNDAVMVLENRISEALERLSRMQTLEFRKDGN